MTKIEEFEKALDEYARTLLAESDENDGNAIGYADAIATRRARSTVERLFAEADAWQDAIDQALVVGPQTCTDVLHKEAT